MALGALLLVAWFAPPASACGACTETMTAEHTCCSKQVAPPPCACESHAGMPLPIDEPDCCPCGYHEAPTDFTAPAASAPPAVNPAIVTPQRVVLARLPVYDGPAMAPATAVLPAAPPAYLLDCALLR